MKIAIGKKMLVWSQLAVFAIWAAASIARNAGNFVQSASVHSFSKGKYPSGNAQLFCVEFEGESTTQDDSSVFDGLFSGLALFNLPRLLQLVSPTDVHFDVAHYFKRLDSHCIMGRAPPLFS